MYPIKGFIEPAPQKEEKKDEFEFPTKKNKIFPMPSSPPPEIPPPPPPPPSYDSAMAQERVQRRLIGDLLQKTSHLFGMHPFRSKIICHDDVCRKLKFCDRIRVVDLVLCIINLFVVLNHLRLGLFNCSQNPAPRMFSTQTLEATLHVIEAALPLVCIIGMMFSSYYMNTLLQSLTDIHCRLFPNRHVRRVKFWRYFLYVINGFFIFGSLMELPQNFLIELRKPNPESHGFPGLNEMPLEYMPSWCDKIIVFIDRYYFPLINFGVVKVPQLFIMMIAIRIAIMFRENRRILQQRASFTRESLENYFTQLMDIVKVLNLLELCFNKMILAIVATSAIKIIFTSYGTLREIFNGDGSSNAIVSIIMENAAKKDDDGVIALLVTLNSTCSLFAVLLNIFWTIIFIVPCIACNEFSRSSLAVITSKLVNDDAKFIKDQIVQKLLDPTWGLTLGGFFKVDRGFAMTLVSGIFTIVVVWLQLTVSTFDIK